MVEQLSNDQNQPSTPAPTPQAPTPAVPPIPPTGINSTMPEVAQQTTAETNTPPVGVQSQNIAVSGPNGPLPPELNGWNWGAFLLNWIWSIGNQSYIGLLALISPISLIVSIILGIKGNEWAWQHRKFESVEQFKAVQKAWTRWGIGLFIVSIVSIFAVVILISLSVARDKAKVSNTPSPTINTDTTSTPVTVDTSLLDKTASNADLGLTFSMPKGWQQGNAAELGADLVAKAALPDEEGNLAFYPNINVVHEETGGITIDQYLDASKERLASELNGYSLISTEKITVGEKEARLVCYTFTQGIYNLKDYSLIEFNNSKTISYIVTATSLASTWDRNEQAMRASLLTFNSTK